MQDAQKVSRPIHQYLGLPVLRSTRNSCPLACSRPPWSPLLLAARPSSLPATHLFTTHDSRLYFHDLTTYTTLCIAFCTAPDAHPSPPARAQGQFALNNSDLAPTELTTALQYELPD